MALSVFDEKSQPPSASDLRAALGRSHALWVAIHSRTEKDYGRCEEEWNFAGQAYGWSCRLIHEKRRIVYLIPCRGHFLAGFCLGEKAVEQARAAGLPPAVLAVIECAPVYAEGRGFRLPVRTRNDLGAVSTLIDAKIGASAKKQGHAAAHLRSRAKASAAGNAGREASGPGKAGRRRPRSEGDRR
ncbi:MAG: DUF3788 family protein [Candidatus Eisenbacteria bacterium]|nr:DUF3788 family protein [Candidatus Eisenbacteria bacterium]